jgi:putative thioredoxin
MFFGKNEKIDASSIQDQKTEASKDLYSYDVSADDFNERVMQASMERPVLVDMWAPWCGPCKQFMPILEAAVKDAKGKVILAKVNIDDNPSLAQALRVQSVPTVFVFFMGQPVTAFQGVKSPSEIKGLIDQILKMAQQSRPDALDIPAALAAAAKALAEGHLVEAQNLYIAVLEQEEENPVAYAGLIRTFIEAGELEPAQGMVDNAPDKIKNHAEIKAAAKALELAGQKPDSAEVLEFSRALEANENDHQARFDLARALYLDGKKEEALDHLLEIVMRNRTWEDEKARKQILIAHNQGVPGSCPGGPTQ